MKDIIHNIREKKATLTYLATKLPEKNFHQLKEAFKNYD